MSKFLLWFAASVFTFALVTTTTAQESKPRRHIDIQVPKNVSIEVKLRKDKETEFQDLNNEHWIRAFEWEVKNTVSIISLSGMELDWRAQMVKPLI